MLSPFKSNPGSFRRSFLAACALAAIVHNVAALADSEPARVERAAREHLLALAQRADLSDVQVKVTLVPRGDTPASCPQATTVEALDTRHITRMRFAVTCPGTPELRTLFVVRGEITANVVVATAVIAANRPIVETQLAQERRDVSMAPDATSDIGAIVGQASRRAIRAGQVIATRWLVQPVLVRRGSAVDIVARNAGVEVRVAGEVQENGRRDEIVRVRNVTNGNVITARVIDEHTVETTVNSAH
jgi:flagella basal body P-ring formation protein FlgA